MLANRGKLLLPLLAGSLLLSACGDDSTGGDTSRLTLKLTDAPGDLAEAWVKVERVYLQGSSPADSLSGRQELATPTGWIDLLSLTGGTTMTLVNAAPVPSATYSQLRLVVCEAYVKTKTGTVFATDGATLPAGVTATGELRTPSACQSGFKVKLPGNSLPLEGGATSMIVDFDVSQSFGREAGNSGQWVMRPVLHATFTASAGAIAGNVTLATGVTMPACGGAATNLTHFVPRALVGADSVGSGTTEAGGAYRIASLSPNTYTLGYADKVGFANGDSLTVAATPTPASVTVASGATAAADFRIDSASCKVKPAT